MSDWQILGITGAVILGIVLLIIKVRLNPVVSLIIGSLTLGVTTGMTPGETTDTVMKGFGDIMYEIGLLIVWGVLLGAILNKTGAIERLVERLLSVFGKRGVPYALGVTIGAGLQAIFLDVLLVMAAPLARRIAPSLGRNGIGKMSAAMAISLEVGIVLMVPGVATMALAGLLGVPLGKMLIFGFIVVVPTIVVSIALMNFVLDRGFWNPSKDEELSKEESSFEESFSVEESQVLEQSDGDPPSQGAQYSRIGTLPHTDAPSWGKQKNEVPLLLLFAPLLLTLILIAGGALLEMGGITHPVIDFFAAPVSALLIGLIGTGVVGRMAIGSTQVEEAIVDGFRESGQILALTGAGGSLGAVVATSGMGDILGKYFAASTSAPLLTVWAIAAILHIAVGSVSISAITAAGLLAPVAPTIGLDPVLIALAAGAGSLFLVHVTSNTFWLLKSMMGQSTRGTFKTCSVGVSVASVVALILTLVLSIFI
ncbi:MULTISPECIES: GntP family permease [Corynebacterium]|uniref:Gluconate permease n=1 Tax=Corynebacterium hadale TaxID=2026255 RepID=A0A269PBJ6_9CORY|nr:SLC13 family permease [Corynebacterium hadale]PAJ69064.1 gluconate permease [Corynebacterium hadale]WKC61287.1 Gnt-II system L-idonate transporter [Corynebacterium hadale]